MVPWSRDEQSEVLAHATKVVTSSKIYRGPDLLHMLYPQRVDDLGQRSGRGFDVCAQFQVQL